MQDSNRPGLNREESKYDLMPPADSGISTQPQDKANKILGIGEDEKTAEKSPSRWERFKSWVKDQVDLVRDKVSGGEKKEDKVEPSSAEKAAAGIVSPLTSEKYAGSMIPKGAERDVSERRFTDPEEMKESAPNKPLPPIPSKFDKLAQEIDAELKSIGVGPNDGNGSKAPSKPLPPIPSKAQSESGLDTQDMNNPKWNVGRSTSQEDLSSLSKQDSVNQRGGGDDEKIPSPPNKPLPPVPSARSASAPPTMESNSNQEVSSKSDNAPRPGLTREDTKFEAMPVTAEQSRRATAAAMFEDAKDQSMSQQSTAPKRDELGRSDSVAHDLMPRTDDKQRDFKADMDKAVADLQKGKAVGPISNAKADDAKSPSESPQKAADTSKSQGRG